MRAKTKPHIGGYFDVCTALCLFAGIFDCIKEYPYSELSSDSTMNDPEVVHASEYVGYHLVYQIVVHGFKDSPGYGLLLVLV